MIGLLLRVRVWSWILELPKVFRRIGPSTTHQVSHKSIDIAIEALAHSRGLDIHGGAEIRWIIVGGRHNSIWVWLAVCILWQRTLQLRIFSGKLQISASHWGPLKKNKVGVSPSQSTSSYSIAYADAETRDTSLLACKALRSLTPSHQFQSFPCRVLDLVGRNFVSHEASIENSGITDSSVQSIAPALG